MVSYTYNNENVHIKGNLLSQMIGPLIARQKRSINSPNLTTFFPMPTALISNPPYHHQHHQLRQRPQVRTWETCPYQNDLRKEERVGLKWVSDG